MNYNKDKRYIRNEFRFFIPVIIIAGVFLLSFVVMLLWNAILPALLHVSVITYWQAVGLFILCKILFGNFRRNPRSGGWRGGPPWRQKWMNMSEEERTKFREEWKKRCGPRGSETEQ